MADAKVQGCDRGSRKKHERCWEAFDGVLAVGSPFHQRFLTCVNTYQAVPVLRKKKGLFEKLPSFAQWLGGEKNKGKLRRERQKRSESATGLQTSSETHPRARRTTSHSKRSCLLRIIHTACSVERHEIRDKIMIVCG